MPTIFIEDDDFNNFPEMPRFDEEPEEIVLDSGIAVVGNDQANNWVEWFNSFSPLTTQQKITLATTIPSLVVLVMFAVIIGGCCFYRRSRPQANGDVEVILI